MKITNLSRGPLVFNETLGAARETGAAYAHKAVGPGQTSDVTLSDPDNPIYAAWRDQGLIRMDLSDEEAEQIRQAAPVGANKEGRADPPVAPIAALQFPASARYPDASGRLPASVPDATGGKLPIKGGRQGGARPDIDPLGPNKGPVAESETEAETAAKSGGK